MRAEAHPTTPASGLTSEEVAARVAAGQVNEIRAPAGRTVATILRANVLTRFNAILGSLFVVVLVVGPPQDALFGFVIAVNTAIGVVQEVRAKATLDRLAVLTAPAARARRDGTLVTVPVAGVVLDDVVLLEPGEQVVADGRLLDSDGLEVDESLLSGEAEPAPKAVGDQLLSGSFIVAGTAEMVVTRVGDDAYAQRLQGEARHFDQVRSELRQGTNDILRAVTWVMIPAGLLLVTSQVVRSGLPLDEALRGSVAGVGAMVPEGLVLLTSIAFAVGAMRLARRRVLVQELAAIEGLARVDVLCIDKTGTLTEPGIALGTVEPLSGGRDDQARTALAALAWTDPAPNATAEALRALPEPPDWVLEGRVPFSSARKWSLARFEGRGTWVLGAPEIVVPDIDPRSEGVIARATSGGRRVVLLAYSAEQPVGESLPSGLEPVAAVVLEERVRRDAPDTLAYLLRQGVRVRVLSGDNPTTVGAVATQVGIPGGEDPVDARELPDDREALADIVETRAVFGRVRPEQKRAVVDALQSRGHVVAMTGDGVNDIPALKAADLGMAVGSGSPATRAVGRVVLLDSSFAVVPDILDEGRRVIANVQRVANLFVTKTVYAALLAIVVGLVAVPYPFYPRHLTVVSALTIGIPGFFLALAPGAPRAHPGFVRRVVWFCVPTGTVAAVAALSAYLLARGPAGATVGESRTVATFVLLGVGLAVLVMVARPMTALRWVLVVAMAGSGLAVWGIPLGRHLFGLPTPPAAAVVIALGVVAIAIPAVVLVVRATGRRAGEDTSSAARTSAPTV